MGGLTRDGYAEAMAPIIDSLHSWDDLDGIDMHGQNGSTLEPWAATVWRRCKEAGKISKVHAGEFGGPEKIWEALDASIQAVFPELVSRLVDEGIILDMCPISNEKLKVVDLKIIQYVNALQRGLFVRPTRMIQCASLTRLPRNWKPCVESG